MSKAIQPVGSHFLLVKFSHTIFAIPFTFIGFFLATEKAGADISWKIIILAIAAMIFARNTARNFNRYINRGITTHEINYKITLLKIIVYTILFVITSFFINDLVFKLSPLALVIVSMYALAKKSTVLSHFILGINFSLVPVGAFLSLTGTLEWAPVVFSLIVLFWISGFDILYAIVNEDFYIEKNIKSLPLQIGTSPSKTMAMIMHVLAALLTLFVGQYLHLGRWYGIGILVFTGLLLYQYLIISNEENRNTSFMFLICNSFTGILYAGFTVLDLLFS